MRFLPGKGLFIALRWMQPDRGMMWQAENQNLARDFPAGTASRARRGRLHRAQGVFPVVVFQSFVRFLNNACSKKFSPLMPINCLINRRVKERKRQSDKKTKGQKPRKPLEEYGGCAAAVILPFWSYKSRLLTPNRQHPSCLLSEGCHSLQGDKQK